MPDAVASPFPPRQQAAVRVASVAEERAFLRAYPPSGGPWNVQLQTLFMGPDGPEDHIRIVGPHGEDGMVPFAIGSFFGDKNTALDAPDPVAVVMEAALDWAKENEPLHPGAMPRFPVPAAGYPGRVAVPLALQARGDDEQRGLFGPTRSIIVGYPGGEITGAVDAPGFDPDQWPPSFRGLWPPPGAAAIPQDQLAGSVTRFSALWDRLLTAFPGNTVDDPWRSDEAAEALVLLRLLDPPGMLVAYRSLNPAFSDWLTGLTGHPMRED